MWGGGRITELPRPNPRGCAPQGATKVSHWEGGKEVGRAEETNQQVNQDLERSAENDVRSCGAARATADRRQRIPRQTSGARRRELVSGKNSQFANQTGGRLDKHRQAVSRPFIHDLVTLSTCGNDASPGPDPASHLLAEIRDPHLRRSVPRPDTRRTIPKRVECRKGRKRVGSSWQKFRF